jgi:hypothetical protein
MGTHMKTTIDIADALLRQAKQEAQREGTTLKSVVERALREMFSQKPPKARKFKPVIVHGRTPPEVFQNLHQLILNTYEEHALERLRRAGGP